MAFSVSSNPQQIAAAIKKQRQMIQKIETKGQQFLDAAARIGVNESKDKSRAGTWQDRTGNLRSSIDHFLESTSSGEQAMVFAGMEYAPFVHYRDGYEVLVFPPKSKIKSLQRKMRL